MKIFYLWFFEIFIYMKKKKPMKHGLPELRGTEEKLMDNQIHLIRIENDRIRDLLGQTSSENPLDPKIKKEDLLGKIVLKDPTKVIRVKPMQYNPAD